MYGVKRIQGIFDFDFFLMQDRFDISLFLTQKRDIRRISLDQLSHTAFKLMQDVRQLRMDDRS